MDKPLFSVMPIEAFDRFVFEYTQGKGLHLCSRALREYDSAWVFNEDTLKKECFLRRFKLRKPKRIIRTIGEF